MIRIKVGCDLNFEFPQPTPMIVAAQCALFARFRSRTARLRHHPTSAPLEGYRDSFGNWCTRFVAPAGHFEILTDAIVHKFRRTRLGRGQRRRSMRSSSFPPMRCNILLGSRYCETDLLSNEAWRAVRRLRAGLGAGPGDLRLRPQPHAASPTTRRNPTLTALRGLCRAAAFAATTPTSRSPSRAASIFRRAIAPATSATSACRRLMRRMDFSAWMEVFLGGRWYVFDPRNNAPRIGRILVAHGRDAADVPLTHSFGPNTLSKFEVWAEEVPPLAEAASA